MKRILLLFSIIFFSFTSYGQPGGGGGFIINTVVSSTNKILSFNCSGDTCLKVLVYKLNLVDSGIVFTNSDKDILTPSINVYRGLFLENEHGTNNDQRVIFILRSDTMILDLINIPRPNPAGVVGGIDTLVFEKGYFVYAPKYFTTNHNVKRQIAINLSINNNFIKVPSFFYKGDPGVLIYNFSGSKSGRDDIINFDSLQCRVFITSNIRGVQIKESKINPSYLDFKDVNNLGFFVDQELCVNKFNYKSASKCFIEFSYNHPGLLWDNPMSANLLVVYNKDTMLLDLGQIFGGYNSVIIIDTLKFEKGIYSFNNSNFSSVEIYKSENLNEIIRVLNSKKNFLKQTPYDNNPSSRTIEARFLLNYDR